MDWLRDVLLQNTYSLESEDPDDGGPLCASMMTNTYRISVILVTVSYIQVAIHYFVYTKFSYPYVRNHIATPAGKPASPSKLEIFLGINEILIIVAQIVTKTLTKRLIFIFSPCHVITLVQSILLLSSYTVFKEKLFVASISWIFAP
jgi:hypothetical protein